MNSTLFSKCRLCLEESKELHPIFTNEIIPNICDIVLKYADIKIAHDDNFPHEICKCCIRDLEFVDKFLEKCKKSDLKLRELLSAGIKKEREIAKVFECDNFQCDVEIKDEDSKSIDASDTCHFESDIIKKSDEQVIDDKGHCECNVCGLKLKCRSALKIHLRIHTGEKPFECYLCTKTFGRKSNLQNHMKRKHKNHNKISIQNNPTEPIFYCEACGKAFKKKRDLHVHFRVHTQERPYKCDECGNTFTQSSSLSIHKRRHRGERPYACDICQKTFVEMTHLKRHSKVHSKARPFICNICGKGFKSSQTLKQHIKLHSNNREHVCYKCGISFNVKGNLDAHVRVVHSERSGQCTVCNKLCSNIEDHMTIHSGEKKHECDLCSKKFPRKRGLIMHLKQHNENKKYSCHVPGCGKTFYAQRILACHLVKHLGNYPYSCKLCNKGFVRTCHLTKHMKNSHPDYNSSGFEVTHV